jgi:hypothetical protein
MPRKRTTAILGGDRVGLDDAMLKCRIYRHAWDDFYPDNLGTPLYGWRLSLRCTRCTTERHDIINAMGALDSRRYIYPEGYQMGRDETPSREDMRLAMFDRIRTKLAKADAISSELVA